MIKKIEIKSFKEKLALFKEFNPESHTWVVSDLKSKLEMQSLLLRSHPLLEENAILRASELWKKWLTLLRPDLKMVSTDLLRSQLSEKLKAEPFHWARTPGAAKTLLNYMQQLIPIFVHPDGEAILADWFKNHGSSFIRWGHWYELAKKYWQEFQEDKVYTAQWIPALLQQEDLNRISWGRDLIFDLGYDLSPIEVDLIKSFACNHQIKMLSPEPDWVDSYKQMLWTYELIDGGAIQFEKLGHPSFDGRLMSQHKNIEYRKFASAIAEVKDAVAQVRLWLDEGVPPTKIGLMAPDLEHYWPSLQSLLKIEGVPVNKSGVSRLSSYPEISSWLSQLTLYMKKVKTACLEEALYKESIEPAFPYELFRRLFKNIYDETDVSRHKYVKNFLSQSVNPDDLLTRDEFIGKACGFINEKQNTERFELLISRFYQETYPTLRISYSQWLTYLHGLTVKIEINIHPAREFGIQCENLSSAEWLDVKKMIILGCTESQFRGVPNIGLTNQEVLSLNQQTGFALMLSELDEPEFDSLWVMEQERDQIIFSCSVTDFSGQVEAPCKLWLSGALDGGVDIEQLTPMRPNRGDELQNYFVGEWKDQKDFNIDLAPGANDELIAGIQRDCGAESVDSKIELPVDVRLSVSQVEGYLSCPFIFAARKLFSLSDLPDLDLDIDHMTKGQLMHALFEHLTKEPFNGQRSAQEIGKILESIKSEDRLLLGDESVWPAVKKQHISLGLRFLSFERDWRERFPQTKTIGREAKISAFWNSSQKEFSNSEGDFPFLGFIDRVDKDDQGQYALVDYKSSPGQSRYWGSWLSQESLQLSLYTHAIEKGYSDLPPGRVVAGNYFVSRTMDRRKGFHLEPGGKDLVGEKVSRWVSISEGQKAVLIANSIELFGLTVEKIKAGDFAPKPKEFATCPTCPWQKICRAKHLN